jgi:hypothetical protein
MPKYVDAMGLVESWVNMRADVLTEEWRDVVHEVIGCFGSDVLRRISDSATRQARSECLAYVCHETIPTNHEALSELLAWLCNNHSSVEDSEAVSPNINRDK